MKVKPLNIVIGVVCAPIAVVWIWVAVVSARVAIDQVGWERKAIPTSLPVTTLLQSGHSDGHACATFRLQEAFVQTLRDRGVAALPGNGNARNRTSFGGWRKTPLASPAPTISVWQVAVDGQVLPLKLPIFNGEFACGGRPRAIELVNRLASTGAFYAYDSTRHRTVVILPDEGTITYLETWDW